MNYKRRIIDDILDSYADAFNATLIVGPKGCGKTTTAKNRSKTIIEFQDEDKRDNYLRIVNTTPSLLLKNPKPILFDEWQDAPKIWGAIRKDCDDFPNDTGAYFLTGSTSQKVEVPHTGTLRISRLKMYPMSLFESGDSNGTISLIDLFNNKDFIGCKSNLSIEDIMFLICRGGWPRTINISKKEAQLLIAKELFNQICYVDINNIDKNNRDARITELILKSYSRNICTLVKNSVILQDINKEFSLSENTFYQYIKALNELFIIEDIEAWCPAIRSKSAIRSTTKKNLIDPSIATAALGISPKYFLNDFKLLGFMFESLCIRDLKIYSSKLKGKVSYYHDRYGLEADCVLHLEDGRYALIEFKLGENEIDLGAKHLCEIESLIKEYNKTEIQCPLRQPDLKIIITATEYGYKREDGVLVVPLGCLKD